MDACICARSWIAPILIVGRIRNYDKRTWYDPHSRNATDEAVLNGLDTHGHRKLSALIGFAGRPDTQLIGHADQFSEQFGFHLGHHLGPMNFDCPFSSAEFGARLFIEQSRCDQLEDLALAGVRSS